MRAHKAHIRPGDLKGHGGLRTPCFSFGESSGVAPSYPSYTSYMSYRAVFLARRRRAEGAGESGSLEAWMLGSLAFSLYNYFACRPLVGVQLFRLSPACRAFCSPFSVLRSPGRESALPLPGRGAAPHTSNQLISQSAKILFVSFVSFVIEKYSGVLPAVAGP